MALLVAEGFDEWNAGRSNALINKTYPSGVYIVACSVSTNTTTRYGTGRATNMSNFEEVQWQMPTNMVDGYVAFQYLRQQASGNPNVIVQFKDGATGQCDLRCDVNGSIYLTRNGTTVGAQSANNVCPLGSWVWMSVYCKIDDVNGRMEVYVDGIKQLDITGDTKNTANAYFTRVVIDQGTNILAQRDDLFIMDATGATFNGHIAETRIVPLVVTGDGAASDWTASAGADWQCVDEIPPTDDTDYISSSTPGQISLFATGSIPAGVGAVLAVYAVYRGRKDDAAVRQIRNVVRTGGVNYNSATDTISSSYVNHTSTIYELNPNTGLAWTAGEANGAEIGVEEIA